jgi:hypothetical protein
MEHVKSTAVKTTQEKWYKFSSWLIGLAAVFCLIEAFWNISVVTQNGHILNNGFFHSALLFIIMGYLNSIMHYLKSKS